jgi:hypothetical protein
VYIVSTHETSETTGQTLVPIVSQEALSCQPFARKVSKISQECDNHWTINIMKNDGKSSLKTQQIERNEAVQECELIVRRFSQ